MATVFSGISNNRTMSSVRGKLHAAAGKWWPYSQLLHDELEAIAVGSGLDAELRRKKLKRLSIELRFDNYFAVDLQESGFQDGARGVYYVCVHSDASTLAEGVPDEARYWPLKTTCIEAFCNVADTFSLSQPVKDALADAFARCPKVPPWPVLPQAIVTEDSVTYAGVTLKNEHEASGTTAVSALGDEAGTLWVVFERPIGVDVEDVFAALKDLLAADLAGEWEGDSSNDSEADISFQVASLSFAAERVANYMRERWPETRFAMADQPLSLAQPSSPGR